MQIYVACLASYNNGVLHGEWIAATDDVDEMQEGVDRVMRTSPYPNVSAECPDCDGTGHEDHEEECRMTCITCAGVGTVPSAEEWAIHDFDGLPTTLGEYCGLQAVADCAEFIEGCESTNGISEGDAVAILDNWQGVVKDASDAMDNFAGIHDSFRDYSDNFVDECMIPNDAPDILKQYFDYASYARDLQMEMTVLDVAGGVAVFYS